MIMNEKIIFLKPFLAARIWGGKRLQEFNYHFENENDKIGEAWIVSALPNQSSIITNSNLKGITLDKFYEANSDFFGNFEGDYPILTKIIDANDDLSIQVHPNDEYAKIHHGGFGKTECWYILDAPENAQIVYGVKTKDKQATQNLIEQKKWKDLLNYLPVKKGDIIYVPSGAVHAITSGILIYELQQSSDITYRLYDYDRKDDNGNLRELHLDHGLNVIEHDLKKLEQKEDFLIDCPFFKLKKIDIKDKFELFVDEAYWLEVTVIEGQGMVDGIQIKKGDVFLVRNKQACNIEGNLTALVGYVQK